MKDAAALLDAFPERIAVLDRDGVIVATNRAWRAGMDDRDVSRADVGASYVEVCDRAAPLEPVARAVATALRDVLAGRREDFETPPDLATASGRRVRLLTTPEAPGRVLVVHEDASSSGRARSDEPAPAAKRDETLAAMGALVAGVAHEVRNPLFAISSTLDAFEAELGEDAPATRPWIDVLRSEVTRMTALMSDLVDYGRPPRLQLAPLSVVDAVHAGVAACVALVRSAEVRVRIEHADGAGRVMGDAKRLAQVFQHLVENAVQHSPKGGEVVVRMQETTADDAVWLDCAVLDDGPGFRAKDVAHLFDPFFTRRRGGTGLGLAIVQRIAREHGGEVSAATRDGGGAAVVVRLPALARGRSRRLA